MSYVSGGARSSTDFLWECFKSVFVLMSVFKSRKKAPPFCFSFFLILWAIYWYNFFIGDLKTDEWGLPKHLHTVTMTDIINSPSNELPELMRCKSLCNKWVCMTLLRDPMESHSQL